MNISLPLSHFYSILFGSEAALLWDGKTSAKAVGELTTTKFHSEIGRSNFK